MVGCAAPAPPNEQSSPAGRDFAVSPSFVGKPDLNRIEQLFAKLKALLRKAAERTIEALWATIGRLLDDLPADECSHYLAHAGYRSI